MRWLAENIRTVRLEQGKSRYRDLGDCTSSQTPLYARLIPHAVGPSLVAQSGGHANGL